MKFIKNILVIMMMNIAVFIHNINSDNKWTIKRDI